MRGHRHVGTAVAIAALLALAEVSEAAARTEPGSSERTLISYSLGDLYTVGVAGGDVHKLTPAGRIDTAASFSPTGRRIAFAAASKSKTLASGLLQTVLTVMRSDGSRVRVVTRSVLGPSEIVWSHDGRRLAFKGSVLRPPGAESLFMVDLVGGRIRQLPATEQVTSQEWSPSGRLGFSRVRHSGPTTAVVLTRKGRQLWETRGWFAGWSPDGTMVLVRREQRLLVLAWNGRRIAAFRGGLGATWSPDGQKIAFTRDGALWVATLRNRHVRRVGPGGNVSPPPLFWSPDSRRLAFLGVNGWMIESSGNRSTRLARTGHVFAWVSNTHLLVSVEDHLDQYGNPPDQRLFGIVAADGSSATVLARFPYLSQVHAALSPDRRTVLFFHAYL